MTKFVTNASRTIAGEKNHGDRWSCGPSVEERVEDEDGLDLPVDPDEGMPLIPDDERVIDVPS